jgi:hypothetical protein
MLSILFQCDLTIADSKQSICHSWSKWDLGEGKTISELGMVLQL